jgi:hypothetical protein
MELRTGPKFVGLLFLSTILHSVESECWLAQTLIRRDKEPGEYKDGLDTRGPWFDIGQRQELFFSPHQVVPKQSSIQ